MALSKYDIQLDLEQSPGTSHALMVDMVGANKRVLDVGCDTGYLGEVLGALGNVSSGFEINEETARKAREHLVRVEVGDLEATDLIALFGPGSFDVVVFGDVLEHLRDPLPTLRQSRSLLAPGGSVLISTPNVAHGDVRLSLLQGNFRYNRLGILDETHTRFFTRESLVDFVHDAGFVVLDLRRTHAPLFSTEIGVKEQDFEPGLVERLREDSEATTYQFVLRAVPDDQTQVSSAQALRVDELTAEVGRLKRFEADVNGLRHRLLVSRDYAIGAEAETGRLRSENDRMKAELAAAQRELESLRGQVPDLADFREHQLELARMRRLYDELKEAAAPLGSVIAELDLTKQRLALSESELGSIKGSRTWRVGNAIVAPLARITGRRSRKSQ